MNIGAEVHENENYVVVIMELGQDINGYKYTHGYGMKNKNTGVMEYVTPSLPDALFTSEQFNHAITSQSWKWRTEDKRVVKTALADLVN